MGILDIIKGQSKVSTSRSDLEMMCYELEQSLSYRKLALEIATDLVGNTVASVNWKEFKNSELKNGKLAYTLNVSTNELETSSEFFKHYVKRMFYDGECLIVPDTATGNLYIAESFDMITKSRSLRYFTNITYAGVEAVDEEIYTTSEVIHIEYNKDNIRRFMNGYLNDYEQLVKSATSSYQSNKTRRFILSSNMFNAQTTDTQKQMNELFTKQLSEFAGANTTASVYAKGNNWEVTDMSDKQIESAKDSRDLINDIFAVVAQTYHIPVQMILTGMTNATVTDKIIENYLLNIVYPLVNLFKEGLNTYNYLPLQYQKGSKVEADLSKVRLANMQTLGTFIASVFPTGALSLNDIVTEYLQLPPLPSDIGDIRVITKNYAKIDDFNAGLTTNLPPSSEPTPQTNNKGDND